MFTFFITILDIYFFLILQNSLGINSYFKKKRTQVDFDQVDFDSG